VIQNSSAQPLLVNHDRSALSSAAEDAGAPFPSVFSRPFLRARANDIFGNVGIPLGGMYGRTPPPIANHMRSTLLGHRLL